MSIVNWLLFLDICRDIKSFYPADCDFDQLQLILLDPPKKWLTFITRESRQLVAVPQPFLSVVKKQE